MKYENKTILELKDICKKRDISGYSKLNKDELIRLIKKHLPKKKSISPKSKIIKSKIIKPKKMKGGEEEGVEGIVSLNKTIIKIMLFIGEDMIEAGNVELDRFYSVDKIIELNKKDLVKILKDNKYYETSVYQTYIILKEFITKKRNKNNSFFNNIEGNPVLNNEQNRYKYMRYKLYKKYKAYIDNSEFETNNEPLIVIALDKSIIYSSKPFKSKLLTNKIENMYQNNYSNNRKNNLKLPNN